MIGSYNLVVKTKQVSFELVLERQITIIRGDTATGKSYFAESIHQYEQEVGSNTNHTVKVISDFKSVSVITNPTEVETKLKGISGGLIIMDEVVVSAMQTKLAEIILGSDNYFILITRLSLEMLPYSIWEIYEFNSNLAIENGKSYTKTISIRRYKGSNIEFRASKLLVEDSGTGYTFFKQLFPNTDVVSANGNSNIHNIIENWSETCVNSRIGIILDSAAYGPYIDRLMSIISDDINGNEFVIFTPESFEWLMLQIKVLSRNCSCLKEPYLYCETKKYHSWEVLFEEALATLLKERYRLSYNKGITDYNNKCMQFFLKNKQDVLNVLKLSEELEE